MNRKAMLGPLPYCSKIMRTFAVVFCEMQRRTNLSCVLQKSRGSPTIESDADVSELPIKDRDITGRKIQTQAAVTMRFMIVQMNERANLPLNLGQIRAL
jgi:hypothetical protein